MWNVIDLTSGAGERLYFTHVKCTDVPYVDKCVLIDANRNIQYFIHNKPVSLASKKCPSVLCDVKSLVHILTHFENQRVCIGLENDHIGHLSDNKAYKDSFETWRHKNCTLLATTKYCIFCCRLVHNLKQKYANIDEENRHSKDTIEKLRLIKLRKDILSERRQKARAKMQVESLTNALTAAKEEIASIRKESIETKCNALNMSASERLAVTEIISAASKKDTSGHRYSEEWLNLSMQMSMRSPSFYNFLRETKILPLPCMKTVNKYISQMVENSGLNSPVSNIVETIEIEIENT